MDEKPLYEDPQLMITNFGSTDEHLLFVNEKIGEQINFIIPRGCLKEFAETPRGELERKLHDVNPLVIAELKQERIDVDYIHIALCQAYIENQRRYAEFLLGQDL